MARDLHQYDPYYEDDLDPRRNTRRRRLRVLLLFDRRFRIGLAVIFLSLAACAHRIIWRRESSGGANNDVASRTAADAAAGGGDARQQGLSVGCRPYGCPVYPPELDDDVRSSIETVKERHRAPGSDGRVSELDSSYLSPVENGSSLLQTKFTALSQRGKDHTDNQDRGVVVSPFRTDGGGPNDFLVGIFDGHGDEGHYISRYLMRDVPEKLWEKLSDEMDDEEESIKRILVETFVEADQDAPPNAMNGGSTASVVLRRNNKLYVANAGDSTSFVATYSKSTGAVDIVYRNRFDKPHLPEERDRIEAMGGKVHIPDPHPAGARVIAYSSVKREMVGLAMSRSIGDWEHGAVGVIAEPIVDVVHIADVTGAGPTASAREGDKELFVVSGSDGLFDARRAEFVARRMAKSFYQDDGDPPYVEAENIIGLATPQNLKLYRDDITVLALRVDTDA